MLDNKRVKMTLLIEILSLFLFIFIIHPYPRLQEQNFQINKYYVDYSRLNTVVSVKYDKAKEDKKENKVINITENKMATPINTEVKDNENKTTETVTNRSNVARKNWIKFTATGYCSCAKCTGKTNGITASGKKATPNHTVAMPKQYSFGTNIEIKDIGYFVVEDRGGAIKGNKIDIYFSTHQEALNWGVRTVYLRIC